MFDKKAQKSGGPDIGKTNRIVEGTLIKGDITSQADFRLDGELEGNFISSGKIVIGTSGKVFGDIKCKNADIEGKFKGKMEVEELLTLKASASILGEVITGKLSVEPGAEFTATCSMKSTVKQISKVNGQQAG
ncbi:bactofilin family protein [Flavobacterium litorale]|uniref:Polymer-forming cytoskeletal protein n=1 Tax=Flavobacterium litorale TaxID=2856519 RepID=A0ABX8VAC6_9FLAO|nr:polymer-forming cytoskeletal protein [Flavobacterium litorale]QYJ69083.1 polymer-forming cytoskeletal protein [Flavobacterium litorale]